MTIYETLRKLVDEGLGPDQAADRALAGATKEALARVLRPLVVMEARRLCRGDTRNLEDEVDTRIAAGEDPLSVRRKLSGSEFALPDGRYVPWLDATAADHLARAGWQRRVGQACITDAERHEVAAADIEAAGVTCLRDLETAADEAGAA